MLTNDSVQQRLQPLQIQEHAQISGASELHTMHHSGSGVVIAQQNQQWVDQQDPKLKNQLFLYYIKNADQVMSQTRRHIAHNAKQFSAYWAKGEPLGSSPVKQASTTNDHHSGKASSMMMMQSQPQQITSSQVDMRTQSKRDAVRLKSTAAFATSTQSSNNADGGYPKYASQLTIRDSGLARRSSHVQESQPAGMLAPDTSKQFLPKNSNEPISYSRALQQQTHPLVLSQTRNQASIKSDQQLLNLVGNGFPTSPTSLYKNNQSGVNFENRKMLIEKIRQIVQDNITQSYQTGQQYHTPSAGKQALRLSTAQSIPRTQTNNQVKPYEALQLTIGGQYGQRTQIMTKRINNKSSRYGGQANTNLKQQENTKQLPDKQIYHNRFNTENSPHRLINKAFQSPIMPKTTTKNQTLNHHHKLTIPLALGLSQNHHENPLRRLLQTSSSIDTNKIHTQAGFSPIKNLQESTVGYLNYRQFLK
ncbi:hypothetical protein FGO68_gene6172 [Halteria grandinella]|uniref:Uncharacterized protein n=1 Tax=Halteria grandinella TaxID=5974 RepID=A0A8J8NWP1_HALGN|nr:hypothetical protein FGO68_gene6172 [Halteria grandinella]